MKPFGTPSLLVTLLLLFSNFGYSQLDTEHWLPPLHSRATNQIEDQYVYLSTPVTTPFTVTIADGSGTVLATPVISSATPFVYNVGTGEVPGTKLFVPIDSLNKALRNSGLVLTAPQPFYANERVRSNAQAESITSKGTAAKGTLFRVGGFPQVTEGSSNNDRNFTLGIMATANSTTVTVSNYDPGVLFAGVPYVSSPTMIITLQQGECYVLSGYTNTSANLAGIVGALVQSNNPIVLTNGNVLGNIHPTSNSRDMGIDQSVPVNRLGQDYILIEGNGIAEMECPIVIAHYNNTQIFVNGNSTPITTIQAGQYYVVPNSNYSGSPHRNMYIRTSQPAYVYQALAGSSSQATSGLNFIPPFNCFLPHEINYIPQVDHIGSTTYTGGLMVFTQQGATLQINGVTQTGAVAVTGVPWATYKFSGLTGDLNISSTAAVAAGIFGASSSAGWAGYFSGFSSNPIASDFTYADTCINSITQFTGSYDTNVPVDSFSWDFGDPSTGASNTSSAQNPTHQFSGPGTYTVRFIANRCENDTVIKTVTILDLPTPATVGPTQTNCGTTAVLTGNTITVGNGSWSVISGTGTFLNAADGGTSVSGLTSGTNVFQWTSSNGSCSQTSQQITINATNPPTISNAGSNQTICSDQVQLNGNTPAVGTGVWTLISGSGTIASPSSPTTLVTGLGIGANVFQWTISNAPCTPSSQQVTITQNVPPTTANAGSDQTICSNQVQLNGNTPAVGTGVWTLISGSGTIASPSSPTTLVTGLGIGANVFQWTISNNPCTPSSQQVTITQNASPTMANAGANQLICSNQVQLNGNTPIVGTGTWTLISGSGTITSPNSPTTTVTNLGIGANVFQWTISNAPCTPSSQQVTITRNAPPTPSNAGTDITYCSGQLQLNGNVPSIGLGVWTVISGTATVDNPSSPTSSVSGIGSGNIVLEWTISNAPCPSSSSQVTIINGAITVSQLTNTADFCDLDNGTASVSVSGNNGTVSYLWTPGNLTGPSQTNLSDGSYLVVATDGSGCTGSLTIAIADVPAQQVNAGTDITVCSGTSITLSATNSAGYIWDNGVQNGVAFVPNSTQNYTVTATDINGCVSTDQVLVTVVPTPIADFDPNSSIGYVGNAIVFSNDSQNGTQFDWNFGNNDTESTTNLSDVQTVYSTPGTYNIVLIVTNGPCTDSETGIIEILSYPDPVIHIPNIFTPNGDGLNDEFYVEATFSSKIDVIVVNRWGEVMCTLDKDHPKWTGDNANDGVYFFTYQIVGLNGKEISGQDFVTLQK